MGLKKSARTRLSKTFGSRGKRSVFVLRAVGRLWGIWSRPVTYGRLGSPGLCLGGKTQSLFSHFIPDTSSLCFFQGFS